MLTGIGSRALAEPTVFFDPHFALILMIHVAETYEAAQSGATHEGGGWRPTDGWERTSFTALTTILTGIGFAAMLFGLMALAGNAINARHGALWGLAAFACV